ncbi:MAG: hypothetical protein HKN01_08580, partial [Acidimicrobiia bacterium]|nr:hypothetical protein [Acidimicrobiia bacterium]
MTAGEPRRTGIAGGGFETDDGVEIAYWRWPGGLETTPVVLHHGFTGDTHRDWV